MFFIELNGSTVHSKDVKVDGFARLVLRHGHVIE